MKLPTKWSVCLVLGTVGLLFLLPEVATAQVGGVGAGELGRRVGSLTNKITSVILPAVSILGLVYAAILGASGDQSAKPRMILIIVASVVGFLAKFVIQWFQSASGM